MIVAIYKSYADTCGNKNSYLLGFCEVDSMAEAKEEFSSLDCPFIGYIFDEVKISSKEEIRNRFNIHKD